MTFWLVLEHLCVFWAVVSVFNFVYEMFGGDGVQPYDVMWWICRPISFRGCAPFALPMLIGIVAWIALIVFSVISVGDVWNYWLN